MRTALGEYLHNIGQYDLLTADQEKELAFIYLDENKPEEERRVARDKMINSNLRLVVKLAKNYSNQHLELLDLIQAGNSGLMMAVDKFDPSLGYRFSTFATMWIKQGISKSIIDNGKTIRIPAHIQQLQSKYRKAVDELTRELQGTPSKEEIAERMKVSVEKIEELLSWERDTVSLSKPLGDDSEDTLEDLQPDLHTDTPLEKTIKQKQKQKIFELLRKLKPRTQTIIKMRYGLRDEGDPEDFAREHTLEEVGRYIGITRERVRQIEKQTLSELKTEWQDQF